MKVKSAVEKYLQTGREILIESIKGKSIISVPAEKDFCLEFGERIADAEVKKIDGKESNEVVTIYIS